MPTEEKRPGMLAFRSERRPQNKPTNAQGPTRDRSTAQNQKEQPHRCQHQSSMKELQQVALHPQGQYKAWVSYPVRSLPLVGLPVPPDDDNNPTSTVHQSYVFQPTVSPQHQAAKNTRRKTQIIDGVVYAGSAVPKSTAEPSHSLPGDLRRDLLIDRSTSYFVGCKPIHAEPTVTLHQNHEQKRVPPIPPAQQHTRVLSRKPANALYQCGPISNPASAHLRRPQREKSLPPSPLMTEALPPVETAWLHGSSDLVGPNTVLLCPFGHQTTKLEHCELYFGDATATPPQPAELGASHSPPEISHTTQAHSGNLSASIFFDIDSKMHPVRELEHDNHVDEEQNIVRIPAVSYEGPPVLPEITLVTIESLFEDPDNMANATDEQQRSVAKWYDHYRGLRTWQFDHEKEAAGRKMGGSGTV